MQSYGSTKLTFAGLLGCALGIATAGAAETPFRAHTIGYVLTA
jgi:hypothetical protein